MPTANANTHQRSRGRPRLASRQLLEEAAYELFLEQSFASTSIDDIAQRAGVSRNTFFNYFQSKTDVFWVEIDAALALLPQYLKETPRDVVLTHALIGALEQCADALAHNEAPWILSNFDSIGRPTEVLESAMQRLTSHAAVVKTFVAERLGSLEHELLPQLITNTFLAAAASAALTWGQAGVNRQPLRSYLDGALQPLRESFASLSAEFSVSPANER